MEAPTTRERNILKQLSIAYWEDTGAFAQGNSAKNLDQKCLQRVGSSSIQIRLRAAIV
jgi:hypothetical protein